jgi:hypothetical protein
MISTNNVLEYFTASHIVGSSIVIITAVIVYYFIEFIQFVIRNMRAGHLRHISIGVIILSVNNIVEKNMSYSKPSRIILASVVILCAAIITISCFIEGIY